MTYYIDIIIVLFFLILFIVYGLNQFKEDASNNDYFLASKKISWKKAMFSIVATETSLLTFLSLPSIGFMDDNLFFSIPVFFSSAHEKTYFFHSLAVLV